MNREIVFTALTEMFNRIYATPIKAARGLPPVCRGDLERWALAIAEASPPAPPVQEDGIPLTDVPKWKRKKDEERLALERLELHRQEILNWY